MSFPTTIDSFGTKNTGDVIQAADVNNPQSSIVNIETKVGVDSSAVVTTLDYLLKNTASSDPGHKHTFSSLSNFNVTSPATNDIIQYNGTKFINIQANLIPMKFGGTGSDGALNISSGTTTIDCANANLVVKNYTSISITSTGVLAFTNPATTGTTIILKSQGAVTFSSSVVPMIDLRNMGGTGGNGGGTGASGKSGAGGGGGASIYTDGGTGTQVGSAELVALGTTGSAGLGTFSVGGGIGGSVAAGGQPTAGGSSLTTRVFLNSAFAFKNHNCTLAPGSGGGGGAGGQSSAGTTGGRGAGSIYIECAGAYSSTVTINASGTVGVNNGSANGGGGGGGGGGMIVVLYNTLTSDTGTYTVTGGTGGTAVNSDAGGNGGNGFTLITKNTEFA